MYFVNKTLSDQNMWWNQDFGAYFKKSNWQNVKRIQCSHILQVIGVQCACLIGTIQNFVKIVNILIFTVIYTCHKNSINHILSWIISGWECTFFYGAWLSVALSPCKDFENDLGHKPWVWFTKTILAYCYVVKLMIFLKCDGANKRTN